jgi:hypothetical protein
MTGALITVPLAAVNVYDPDEPAMALDPRCRSLTLSSTSFFTQSGDISTRTVEFIVTPGKWPPRQVR